MRHRPAHAVCLLLLVLLFTGCGDDATKPDETPGTPITLPLQTGNRWTYDVEMVVGEETPETSTQTDSIIGTATVDGESYWTIQSRIGEEGPEASYVRQSGQSVYIRPSEVPTGGSTPEDAWAARKLEESLPWKVADFTSLKGQIAFSSAETTFVSKNLTLSMTINSANLGRTELQVPNGSYSDVYKGRLTQLLVGRFGSTVALTSTTTLDLYVKDGVGVIKQERISRVEQSGQQLITRVTNLLRAHLLTP